MLRKNKSISLQSVTENKKQEIETNAIADFVSVVSHDLKNPLTGIKLFAELAKKKLLHKGDNESVVLIEKIEQQVNSALHQVSELLDTSRITAGKIVLHKQRFNLGTLVQQILEDFQIAVPTYKIQMGEMKGEKVYADKEKIQRVLLNLLTNAVKYSPDVQEIHVSVKHDKKNVVVSIKDYGVGIPLSKQKHLFDPYFRVNEKGKGLAKGYGLGLPIVKKIVEAHDGKVWFESKKGKGSTFYFSLPT